MTACLGLEVKTAKEVSGDEKCRRADPRLNLSSSRKLSSIRSKISRVETVTHAQKAAFAFQNESATAVIGVK